MPQRSPEAPKSKKIENKRDGLPSNETNRSLFKDFERGKTDNPGGPSGNKQTEIAGGDYSLTVSQQNPNNLGEGSHVRQTEGIGGNRSVIDDAFTQAGYRFDVPSNPGSFEQTQNSSGSFYQSEQRHFANPANEGHNLSGSENTQSATLDVTDLFAKETKGLTVNTYIDDELRSLSGQPTRPSNSSDLYAEETKGLTVNTYMDNELRNLTEQIKNPSFFHSDIWQKFGPPSPDEQAITSDTSRHNPNNDLIETIYKNIAPETKQQQKPEERSSGAVAEARYIKLRQNETDFEEATGFNTSEFDRLLPIFEEQETSYLQSIGQRKYPKNSRLPETRHRLLFTLEYLNAGRVNSVQKYYGGVNYMSEDRISAFESVLQTTVDYIRPYSDSGKVSYEGNRSPAQLRPIGIESINNEPSHSLKDLAQRLDLLLISESNIFPQDLVEENVRETGGIRLSDFTSTGIIRYEELRKEPEKFQKFIGAATQKFDDLAQLFDKHHKDHLKKLRQEITLDGVKMHEVRDDSVLPTPQHRLFFVLAHLRLDKTYPQSQQGKILDMNRITLNRRASALLPILGETMSEIRETPFHPLADLASNPN